ncbi:MAG TPA: GIY-YIG nuclease family protein [Ramlibacter sp.]|nr:GIY-YIG nuclease family protein [Ramlibacter sp.]
MPVYFIREAPDGPVKIGHATNVARRLSSLQGGNPRRLEVIRVVAGGAHVERWLHKQFDAARIRLEWFSFVPDMLTIAPPAVAQAEAGPLTPAQCIVRRFGGLAPLSRALGHKHPTTVQGWLRSGWVPAKHVESIRAAAARLGIALKLEEFIYGTEAPGWLADTLAAESKAA